LLDFANIKRLILFLLIIPLAYPIPALQKSETAEEAKGGISIPATRQDDRALFYLPQSWISRYWKTFPTPKAYIAQLPPHKDDAEEDFAPCLPPQRIAMGYIDAGNIVHERLTTCINFCDPRPQGKVFYSGLWGRLTRLDKVDVFVLENGMLDLRLQFKKAVGSEVQTRHLQLKGPREPFPAGGAGSCSTE
jgi:hypothetical protein